MAEENVPKGPWDAPLREYVKNLPLVITVTEGDTIVNKLEIDYGNYNHRKWLGKLTYWAVTNGYSVTTRSKEGS